MNHCKLPHSFNSIHILKPIKLKNQYFHLYEIQQPFLRSRDLIFYPLIKISIIVDLIGTKSPAPRRQDGWVQGQGYVKTSSQKSLVNTVHFLLLSAFSACSQHPILIRQQNLVPLSTHSPSSSRNLIGSWHLYALAVTAGTKKYHDIVSVLIP